MDQGSLFEEENKPVECLGMTFKNDDERREYFRNELRKKLPDLKKIEGFPIGEDEDIIELSDPPYYTACPNPWMNEFLDEWNSNKDLDDEKNNISPFVTDVSEGKYELNYKLHPYHTKVPHKAIMRYILHYTNPGDIVFDGFSGTGMTGVAAQECSDVDVIKSLGYQPNRNYFINEIGEPVRVGSRKVLLNDLAPIASFLSYQHNKTIDIDFLQNLKIIEDIEIEYGWIFKTLHSDCNNMTNVNNSNVKSFIDENTSLFGDITSVLWSEVFLCPACMKEIVFWDIASNKKDGTVNSTFKCSNCGVGLTKNQLKKENYSFIDEVTEERVTHTKIKPVQISYVYEGKKYKKAPDNVDFIIFDSVSIENEKRGVPIHELKEGDELSRAKRSGFKYAHDYYFKKNLLVLAAYKNRIEMIDSGFSLTKVATQTTKLYRYNPKGGGPLSGTMYVPSLIKDLNMINQLRAAIKQQSRRNGNFNNDNYIISTSSMTDYPLLGDDSVDYIFIDPPFGANLMYSELSFLWENWLNVMTNSNDEAIVNNTQKKGVIEYQYLMNKSFSELYRILKSGKWMTIEFSNTSSAIWNAIQNAIQSAGFVIANVSILDKKKGSFKVVTSATAVKQDLVISAYKPLKENIKNIKAASGNEMSSWIFLDQHLKKLPVFEGSHGEAIIITERTPRILFDRMVAYHVQTGLSVPISSIEFQEKIAQKYVMRDGMVFLESQVAEYDKKRILAKEFSQQSLFVSDESSAIEWLRQQLMKKPQSRQDLHPQFMKEIQHIAKHEELPELDNLLVENFLLYDSEDVVPDQIAAYLRKNYHDMRGLENQDDKLKSKAKNRWYVPDPNKQADLEKLREKSLLREFNHYVEEVSGTKKKLKLFRSEAIRAGFKQAWSEKDYQKIVDVAEYLPEKIIQEDDKLLMFHTHALMRLDI